VCDSFDIYTFDLITLAELSRLKVFFFRLSVAHFMWRSAKWKKVMGGMVSYIGSGLCQFKWGTEWVCKWYSGVLLKWPFLKDKPLNSETPIGVFEVKKKNCELHWFPRASLFRSVFNDSSSAQRATLMQRRGRGWWPWTKKFKAFASFT
jgi:hypothetical protein